MRSQPEVQDRRLNMLKTLKKKTKYSCENSEKKYLSLGDEEQKNQRGFPEGDSILTSQRIWLECQQVMGSQ